MTTTPDRGRSGSAEVEPDERYAFVDVRDLQPDPDPDDPDGVDDVDLGDDDEAPAPRPRPQGRPKAPARARGKGSRPAPSARRRRGRDRSTEYAIGALLCMAAFGYAAYWLTREVMGQERDVCLVFAGLVAGLSTWTPRGFVALRRTLARKIAPKGGR
ncbi:hypothetical protein [Nonomuraea rubra]|uniref:hypothetical protein n=1 Tax=Nonomuraea rubra TaxID=46180 RepID=UPI0033F48C26